MIVFFTKGKRVFHVLILYLVLLGSGYTSDRLSYGQASTYCPCHTHYVTVLVFVCTYVRTYIRTYEISTKDMVMVYAKTLFVKLMDWICIRCGQITPKDLIKNRDKMQATYNIKDPIDIMFDQIETGQ